MTITVNGRPRDLPSLGTLASVAQELGVPERGVAIALNSCVVRRADWTATSVSEGDAVEVVTAVQGG